MKKARAKYLENHEDDSLFFFFFSFFSFFSGRSVAVPSTTFSDSSFFSSFPFFSFFSFFSFLGEPYCEDRYIRIESHAQGMDERSTR